MKRLMAVVLPLLLLLGGVIWGMKPAASKVSPAQLSEINQLWQVSAHALAEVNCSSCHQDPQTKTLVVKPTYESCRSCHAQAVETFLLGKHGIRLWEGQTALTPAHARLPMKASARDKVMNCNTCHNVHSVNTFEAAVDSCLTCHNDNHSLNYFNSQHGQMWLKSLRLPRPEKSSVSCATCHLPRQEFQHPDGQLFVGVNHNNTFNLKPRDRMVKDVCMNCHGLEFAYNSIFDDELVEANFDRPPPQELKTIQMMHALQLKRPGKKKPSIEKPDSREPEKLLQYSLPYMEGGEVALLQEALVKAGFELTVDGVFGENTDRVLRQFQEQQGLVSNGILGPETRAALGL